MNYACADDCLVLIHWPIDKIVTLSLRVVTWDVAPQDIITRDNVSLTVNAIVYFLVINATKANVEVENFRYAVKQAAPDGFALGSRRGGVGRLALAA